MNKFRKKLTSKQQLSLSFIIVILLYVLSALIKFAPITATLGLVLLFYFPGQFLIDLVPPLGLGFGKLGKFSLGVIYSFCATSIIGMITQRLWGFNSNSQLWAIISLNIIVFAAYYFFPGNKLWAKIASWKEDQSSNYRINQNDYIAIAILVFTFATFFVVSPLAQNADNFLVILKQSIDQNLNFLMHRDLFVSFLGLTSKFLNLDIAFVYRTIFVALFLSSTFILFDYLKRNLNPKTNIALFYLALLMPSVVLAEVNYIRPQVVLIVLTIPVLVLCVESLKRKKILISIIAFAISAISFLYHELSFLLLLISAMTVALNLGRLIFYEKKIKIKHIILFLILIYPYLRDINYLDLFRPVVSRTRETWALWSSGGFHLSWWFISHFTDADGASVSFLGVNVLLYYLYNGILLLALIVLLRALSSKKQLKKGLYFLPVVLYLLFFFTVAEILPRMGFIFLPSRAWIHIMLASVVLFLLLIELTEDKLRKIRFFTYALISFIVIGYCGALYVAKTNIKEVYNEELPVAEFIKSDLSEDSLVLSSQDNIDLVSIYADHDKFSQMNVSSLVDKSKFEELINTKLLELSQDKTMTLEAAIVQTTDTLVNNQIIDHHVTNIRPQLDRVTKAIYKENSPVYFLYSYRKLNALNTAKVERQDSADILNRDTYRNFGYQIVYSDRYTILMKLR